MVTRMTRSSRCVGETVEGCLELCVLRPTPTTRTRERRWCSTCPSPGRVPPSVGGVDLVLNIFE